MNDTPTPTPVSRQRGALAQALGFAWDFGVIVVVPLVGLGLLGRFLDRRLGTDPWIFLGGVVLSIIISSILVVMKLTKIIADINASSSPPKQ